MSDSQPNESKGAIPKNKPETGKQPYRPKFMDYASYEDRLYTFQKWPANAEHDKTTLAEMGFCYEEQKNQIYCFCCGCEITNIQAGENLWIKHAFCAPDCIYLQNQKGKEFIEEVRMKVYNFGNQSADIETLPFPEQTISKQNNIEIIITKPLDCKICFEREVKILFLPCSHLIACAECAIKLEKCCLCRQIIEYMIRVKLPGGKV